MSAKLLANTYVCLVVAYRQSCEENIVQEWLAVCVGKLHDDVYRDYGRQTIYM